MKAEQENNIIAKIYDAALLPALLPALWLEVVQEIVKYTHSHSAIFTGFDQFNPAYDFVYTCNIPEESLSAYQDERIQIIDMKLHMPLWDKLDMGEALKQDCRHYADDPKTEQYLFYEKCLKPTGIGYMAGVLLDRGNYRWAVMGIHRTPKTQGFGLAELSFLRRIGIHLRRSLQIHRQISLIQQDNLSFCAVLDSLKVGIILLNQDLSLSYSNPLAQSMIGPSACLDLDIHNRLKTCAGDQERLEQLLASALLGNIAKYQINHYSNL